ncbi:MAG TPA: PilZ domain-containing protein [Terriglobales bacterium]|nr:PilZ domain-containing protein [Terriglobales bacterium]
MTEQRPGPPTAAELPVRVFGMGADEHPFFQNARATNFNKEGALLCGLEHQLKVGDTIGVQYGAKKARFKVAWVVEAGPSQKIQVGVQLLSDQECPWQELLTGREKPSPPILPQNRRRFARHKVSVPMEVKDERVNTPMRVNATDISGNGCYIETILPLPKGTTLKVEFWRETEKIATTAVVRACDPGVGMGIEFIGLPEEARQRLQQYLEKVDPRGSGFAEGLKPS